MTVGSEAQSAGLIAPELPWGGILKLHSKGTAMLVLSVCLGTLLLSSKLLLFLPEGMLVGATDTEGIKVHFIIVQWRLLCVCDMPRAQNYMYIIIKITCDFISAKWNQQVVATPNIDGGRGQR